MTPAELQASLSSAQAGLASVQAQLNALNEWLRLGTVSETTYLATRTTLSNKILALSSQISGLQAQIAAARTTEEAARKAAEAAAAAELAARIAAERAAAEAAAAVKAAADLAAAQAAKTSEQRLKDAEAADLIAQANVLYQRLKLGQVTESSFTVQINAINARLAALGWPAWVMPVAVVVAPVPPAAAAVTLDLDPMTDLMKAYGFVAPMKGDAATKASMQVLLDEEITKSGVMTKVLTEIHESPADPAAAGVLASAVAIGCIATIAALGSAGIIAEALSLGQIETVGTILMKVADVAGVSGLGAALAMIPFETGLITPARQYWLSVHQPSLPGAGDLIRFVVKEVLEPSRFKEAMRYQGFGEEWTSAYWDAHWRDISVEQAHEAYHRGILTLEERDKYLVLLDYKPEPRPGIGKADRDIIAGLAKTPLPRVDVRRGFKLGEISLEEMEKEYVGLGYEDKAPLMTKIQARAAYESLQNSVLNEAMYMLSAGKITDADFEALFHQVRDTYDELTLWVTRAQLRKVRMAKPPAEEGAPPPSETELEEKLE